MLNAMQRNLPTLRRNWAQYHAPKQQSPLPGAAQIGSPNLVGLPRVEALISPARSQPGPLLTLGRLASAPQSQSGSAVRCSASRIPGLHAATSDVVLCGMQCASSIILTPLAHHAARDLGAFKLARRRQTPLRDTPAGKSYSRPGLSGSQKSGRNVVAGYLKRSANKEKRRRTLQNS